MAILGFIGSIFKPAADLVDALHTSDDEKLKARNEFARIENAVTEKMLDLQVTLAAAKQAVLVAEAQGSVLQRNWRPVTILSLVALTILDALGVTPRPMPDWMAQLVIISVPGYMGLRSVDKWVTKKKKTGGEE